MRKKYERKIREFAERALENRLEQKLDPYFDYVPDEIQDEMKNEVNKFPLPDEESLGPKDRLGSKLQSVGKEIGIAIADKFLDKIIKQIIPLVEKDVKERREVFTQEQLLFVAKSSKDDITKLKNKIENDFVPKSYEYWRGAGVIITPILDKNIARTHPSDIQVVTKTKKLASSISWLFEQARDIMSSFIDFSNKYEFYGELAETANRIIASDRKYDEKDVLIAILSKVESFRTEWLPTLNDYFDREQAYLHEDEAWISQNRKKELRIDKK